MSKLNKTEIQIFTYESLKAIAEAKDTSAAVKVQALTQMTKLAEQLPNEPEGDELTKFLEENG